MILPNVILVSVVPLAVHTNVLFFCWTFCRIKAFFQALLQSYVSLCFKKQRDCFLNDTSKGLTTKVWFWFKFHPLFQLCYSLGKISQWFLIGNVHFVWFFSLKTASCTSSFMKFYFFRICGTWTTIPYFNLLFWLFSFKRVTALIWRCWSTNDTSNYCTL